MAGKTSDVTFERGYGESSCVILYGPPKKGFWLDSLEVASDYFDPLLAACCSAGNREPAAWIHSRLLAACEIDHSQVQVPTSELQARTTCEDHETDGIEPLPNEDAEWLKHRFSQLQIRDLPESWNDARKLESLECAGRVAEFLGTFLRARQSVFYESL